MKYQSIGALFALGRPKIKQRTPGLSDLLMLCWACQECEKHKVITNFWRLDVKAEEVQKSCKRFKRQPCVSQIHVVGHCGLHVPPHGWQRYVFFHFCSSLSSCYIALKVFKTNTYVALRTGSSSVQNIVKQYLLVGHYNFVLLLYFYFESEVDNQTNKGILKIRVCLHISGD